jgi:hypothetical protein
VYRYFVSQSSEFCRHNPLCCFSTIVYCCLFRYRLSPETFGYTLVREKVLGYGRSKYQKQKRTFIILHNSQASASVKFKYSSPVVKDLPLDPILCRVNSHTISILILPGSGTHPPSYPVSTGGSYPKDTAAGT